MRTLFGFKRFEFMLQCPLLNISFYQVSLSKSAEETLEGTMAEEYSEDVINYWAPMDMDQSSDFWSICDSLNAGHCRCLLMSYHVAL
jgi:hypothetical protein